MSEDKKKKQPEQPETKELDDKELEKVDGGKNNYSGGYFRNLAKILGEALDKEASKMKQ